MPTTFYIVRHGQSVGNINGDIWGTDPELTPKGIEQAEALADALQSIHLDHVIASTRTRAKQTANIIASKKKLPLTEQDRIVERSFGKLEGKKTEEIIQECKDLFDRFHTLSLNEQMHWKLVDDMETLDHVRQRAMSLFQELAKTHNGKTILLVTHAHVLLSLLAHFKFVTSMNQLPYGSIQNTAYLKVEHDHGEFIITEVVGITKKE